MRRELSWVCGSRVAVLRAKGCSSRIRFRSVRKKVRDWVGLNAIVGFVGDLLFCWSVEI
jgi:hypothetical protein